MADVSKEHCWTRTLKVGTDIHCFAQRHSADGGIDVIYLGGAAGCINGLGYVTCREHSLLYSAARRYDTPG
jgi:hypothetical protein